ncbi:MAG: acyltransferase [Actinomycetales bacterium]|nr:acyltransferase [Actinomycetales bacterium]
MNVFIRQLTGVRFVAAAWVLLYHLQGPLGVLGILGIPVLADVLRVGRLGVDLFFALSGFILTHTYLTRLGPRLAGSRTVNFWWLRLARIYPVHLVMLVVAGVAVVAEAKVAGEAPDRAWLNPLDFGKNLLLVQEWGPEPQRGWNFVAWSLSMEWLAYLIFPLLVLLLWRAHRRLPTAALAVLWCATLAPLVAYGLSTTDSYYTDRWGSTIRILTEFTAGALTYLIVRRMLPDPPSPAPGNRADGSAVPEGQPSQRVERLATVLSAVLPGLVIVGAVVLGQWTAAQPPQATANPDGEPLPPYFHLLLVPLLIAWLGALALSRGGLTRALATRLAVLGGFISYSLYMTHLVWFGLWRAAMRSAGITGGALYAVGVVVLVAGALAVAYLMWRLVEEPAREWMRGLVGVRRTPTEEAGEALAEQRGGVSIAPIAVTPDEQQDSPR